MSVKQIEARSSVSEFGAGAAALFSMFFGAGNLVFPLLLGRSVPLCQIGSAVTGLGFTAVLLPFFGLVVMMLFGADYRRFFDRLGKYPGFAVLLLLQLILGPLGVIPRLITLMHATLFAYLPIPSGLFSAGILGLIFVSAVRKKQLVRFLGLYLTPVLLVSLGLLIGYGLLKPSEGGIVSVVGHPFVKGFLEGYNTMDLIAAFFFSGVILPYFKKDSGETMTKSVIKKMLLSSLLAASLLFLTYLGLCIVSAKQGAFLTENTLPEQMLGKMACRRFGPLGGATAALAVVLACLTTAMTLTTVFSDYLRKDLFRERISKKVALAVTLLLTAFPVHFGFAGIAHFLEPLLQIVYPGLIVCTILNFLYIVYGYRRIKGPVWCTFIGSAYFRFFL